MKQARTYKADGRGPFTESYAVTPHASNEIGTVVPSAIYVGGAGNITCRLIGDTADVVFNGVPAGTVLPISPQYIRATGTTATGIVALV